jgi:hypothetical protein
MVWIFAVVLIIQVLGALSKVQVFPSDTYEDCSDGGKAKYMDYSDLEYEYSSDTDYSLIGC